MDRQTYNQIYNSLWNFEDVFKISEKYSESQGAIATLLSQKVVTLARKNHRRIHGKDEELFFRWKKGLSILELSQKFRFPPTLMASLILKKAGISKKSINLLFRNPDMIQNKRLKREVKKALASDYFFSPRAHALQVRKGDLGEAILQKWLETHKIAYLNEAELRKNGDGKTPDFVLQVPLSLEGVKVRWIESKALFGDENEHRHYIKKQFKEYSELFGEGMVVYWYGFLEGLPSETFLIKDSNFFIECPKEVEKLQNFLVYW
ncbi:MAG: C15orf41 family protein [Methanosarcinaceae archaeon]|nr:C15orf41 family protein [Methanosarcinaceae archaeon]MDD4331686.1 C15orf41 family protein [Methanosarcinaceae archaeon]MDD4749219.1 C15orf41 family protein [Methanosarcinaceae archaeon]